MPGTRGDHAARNTRRRRPWTLVIASVAALAVLGLAVWTGTSGTGHDAPHEAASPSKAVPTTKPDHQQSGSDSAKQTTDSGLERRHKGDVQAIGKVDAPVVMIEYADYRCPFCSVFARDTMPKLVKEYIDAGKVRFEWRDFPVFGEESVQAAIAARAAGKQGRYWQFHDAVYEAAPERGHLEVDRGKLIGFAEKTDVPDMAKFKRDLKDKKLARLVQADAEEGQQIGVTATPAFLIGTTALPGAQPIESFRKSIDAELEKAGAA